MTLTLSFANDLLSGEEMEILLERKHQLWDELRETGSLRRIGPYTNFGVVFEGDDPLIYIFEMPAEPGNLSVLLVKESGRVDKRREDLFVIGEQLRDRWFNNAGFKRVEARVPDGFIQTSKVLRRMGFRQETGPGGLRGLVRNNGKPVNIHVFSILPTDVVSRPGDKITGDGVLSA